MRAAIVDAVVHVLTHEGAERLTMDRVATEAGVAKGTLYSYFQDKQDLIAAAVEAKLEPLRVEIATVLDSSDLGPRDRLIEVLRRYLHFFDREHDVLRVLLFERHKSHHPVERHQSSRYRAIVDRMERLIAQGVACGEFRPVDPAKVGPMIIDASLSVVIRRLAEGQRAGVDEDLELLVGVFLRGLDAGDTRPPLSVPRDTQP